MSDYDRNVAARGFGAAPAVAIDAGLRAYMTASTITSLPASL